MMLIRRVASIIIIILMMMQVGGCQQNGTIKVGFAGEISGKGADLGIGARNGVMMAAEEINQRGGIHGKKIEVIARDDQGEPDVARKVDQELIDQGVVAIIGHITSQQTLAGLEVTQPAGVVMISPTASSSLLTGKDDLFFRVAADNGAELQVLGQEIWDRGNETMVIMYDAENVSFAKTYAEGAGQVFQQRGGTILAVIPFSDDDKTLPGLIREIRLMDPDAVLVVASALTTALVSQHIHLEDWEVDLFASDWAYSDLLLQAGGKAIEGTELVVSYDVNSQAPNMAAFRERYIQAFGFEPNYASAQGYEAMMVLAGALVQTGGDAEGLPDGLRGIQNVQGLVSPISIDAFGDVIRPMFLFRVTDGILSLDREIHAPTPTP